MTASNGSVSIEVQWPALPPLNDLTNSTGLHDMEENNNNNNNNNNNTPPTTEKNLLNEVDGSFLSQECSLINPLKANDAYQLFDPKLSVPCKRTCDESATDYSSEMDVKRARAETIAPKEWCRRCGVLETCRWRGGPLGVHTLCNACGLRWKNTGKPTEGFNSPSYPPPELPAELKPRANRLKPKSPTQPKKGKKNVKHAVEEQPCERISIPEPSAIHTIIPDDLSKPDTLLLRKQKQFLIAGMYSSTYKENIKGSAKRPPRVSWKKGLMGPEASRFRVPLPIHQGDWLINQTTDFRLPADIIQEHYAGGLRRTTGFTRIRTNIYVGRKPSKAEQNVVCQCTPPPSGSLGCGDDCLNRMLFYECDPKTCPCGDQCSNRRFQQKKYITELESVLTAHRGWGLRTLVCATKGQLITEYRGEVITHKMVKERMDTIYKGHRNFYFLDYCNGEVIDAGLKGSEARFINHSCDPNCHIEKWALKGELYVGVFASRDIAAGEELFYDYNFSTFGGSADDQPCYCESRKCRGRIGKKPNRRDA